MPLKLSKNGKSTIDKGLEDNGKMTQASWRGGYKRSTEDGATNRRPLTVLGKYKGSWTRVGRIKGEEGTKVGGHTGRFTMNSARVPREAWTAMGGGSKEASESHLE